MDILCLKGYKKTPSVRLVEKFSKLNLCIEEGGKYL